MSTLKFFKFFHKNFSLQDFGSRQIRWFPTYLTPLLKNFFLENFSSQFFEALTLKFSMFFQKNFSLQEFGSRQIRWFLVDWTPLLKTIFEKIFSVWANLGAPRGPEWARNLRHPVWIIHSPHEGVVKKNSHFSPDLQWSPHISLRTTPLQD